MARVWPVAMLVGALVAGQSSWVAASDGESVPREGIGAGVGLSVPWAIGGARIERSGRLRNHPGEWPNMPVSVVRLWDTRTAWLDIEPRRLTYRFARLDANIAKARANGAKVIVVLGGTPRWAARSMRVTDAPWLGPGSASPPTAWADWSRFVRTVVSRYRGQVYAYEIWNEPNIQTFWNGSALEYATLVDLGARAIRAGDPGALVMASGFTVGRPERVARLKPWIEAIGGSSTRIDVVTLHWYPYADTNPMAVRAAVASTRGLMREAGLATTRIGVTEANVREGGNLSASRQRAWIRVLAGEYQRLGVDPVVWYAWSDLVPRDLIQFYPGTPGAQALRELAGVR